MTFADLVKECLLITKRPDLTDRIRGAVKAATQKIHHSDFYYKDLYEVPIEFDEALYIQNFVPSSVIPQFRKAKYLRIWEGGLDGTATSFLEPIQIEGAIDSYGYTKTNVFYMAGQNLQVRTTTPLKRILFGCYLHPIVTEEGFNSWIAREYPFAIVYEACRSVFRSISLNEQANEYAGLFAEILQEIRMSSIDDIPVT